MSDNPYQSPPNQSPPLAESPESPATMARDRGTQPGREARLVVLAVLLTAALLIARLLHAGDLYDLFRTSIPIFLLSIIAYYFGLRHGTR